ncbi:hypothetical protein CK203_105927 [Vitis vinifera]|uniref:Reverse transcriptase zinc-binding domain-containing protein n=1 Tax=Vitis vinifera TaxID=29760 RepID=A0A438E665_VITVI|nr:hypothetical protein CK203_105927 [Vitis vinifera]
MILVGEVDNLEELAVNWVQGGEVVFFLLGLPLGASYKLVAVWDGCKVEIRENWKGFLWGGALEKKWKKIIRGEFEEEERGWRSGVVRGSYRVRARVADLWEYRGVRGNWNTRFVRNLNDWELGVMEHGLESLDSFKGEFLHLEGLLGKGFDFGSGSKKRVDFDQKCALCKRESESIDHIILHCDEARLLWQLVFSIFECLVRCLSESDNSQLSGLFQDSVRCCYGSMDLKTLWPTLQVQPGHCTWALSQHRKDHLCMLILRGKVFLILRMVKESDTSQQLFTKNGEAACSAFGSGSKNIAPENLAIACTSLIGTHQIG